MVNFLPSKQKLWVQVPSSAFLVFWKLQYKMFLIKGLNFYVVKNKHIAVKNLNNYLGYKLNNNYILNLNEIIFWTYILIFFLQTSLRKNASVLFATKFEIQQKVFDILIKNSKLQFQLLKVFTKWVGGCLSNFLAVRWFYLFNGIKFYKQCPDILIILEKKTADPLVSEAHSLNIPVISYAEFTGVDTQVSYLLLGGTVALEHKQNNFLFFIYILKNMLSLESSLKKKKLIKSAGQKRSRKKPYIRVKKNRVYRLFGSRAFNLWRSQFRFTVKFKLLHIKFQLIGKLLLRNFNMNKHFFKKRSTLSYIERLRRRNYTIKSRKSLSFFHIIERRLLVVLARLHITRIRMPDQIKFLIWNGYVTVDNAVIKNPLYLTEHRSLIRIVKTIPRSLSRVPKVLIMNNLRWLFYKRSHRKSNLKPWLVSLKRRSWYRPKKRLFRFKVWRQVKKKSRRQLVRNLYERRLYFLGEIKRRTQKYRWLNRKKSTIPKFPLVWNIANRVEIPFLFHAKLKDKILKARSSKTNKKKWRLFFALLKKGEVSVIKQKSKFFSFPLNKHSALKRLFQNKKEIPHYLSKFRFKDYRYASFFRRLDFNVGNLPFKKRKVIFPVFLNKMNNQKSGNKKWRGVIKSRIPKRALNPYNRISKVNNNLVGSTRTSLAVRLKKGGTPEVTFRKITTKAFDQNSEGSQELLKKKKREEKISVEREKQRSAAIKAARTKLATQRKAGWVEKEAKLSQKQAKQKSVATKIVKTKPSTSSKITWAEKKAKLLQEQAKQKSAATRARTQTISPSKKGWVEKKAGVSERPKKQKLVVTKPARTQPVGAELIPHKIKENTYQKTQRQSISKVNFGDKRVKKKNGVLKGTLKRWGNTQGRRTNFRGSQGIPGQLLKKRLPKRKRLKYNFVFLKVRGRRFKRVNSRSLSRKFFTSVWLVAFIFTKQAKIKKLWYSKLITRRVLTFFCTNFW